MQCPFHSKDPIFNQISLFNCVLVDSEKDAELMTEIFLKYDKRTPILEEDHGFELTLHQRDFTPGQVILANIVEAVNKSRKMFMLLTR